MNKQKLQFKHVLGRDPVVKSADHEHLASILDKTEEQYDEIRKNKGQTGLTSSMGISKAHLVGDAYIGHLVPTKASLFGLDVRFRHIDEKAALEQEKKNATNVRSSGTRASTTNKTNRHKIPDYMSLEKI